MFYGYFSLCHYGELLRGYQIKKPFLLLNKWTHLREEKKLKTKKEKKKCGREAMYLHLTYFVGVYDSYILAYLSTVDYVV